MFAKEVAAAAVLQIVRSPSTAAAEQQDSRRRLALVRAIGEHNPATVDATSAVRRPGRWTVTAIDLIVRRISYLTGDAECRLRDH